MIPGRVLHSRRTSFCAKSVGAGACRCNTLCYAPGILPRDPWSLIYGSDGNVNTRRAKARRTQCMSQENIDTRTSELPMKGELQPRKLQPTVACSQALDDKASTSSRSPDGGALDDAGCRFCARTATTSWVRPLSLQPCVLLTAGYQ